MKRILGLLLLVAVDSKLTLLKLFYNVISKNKKSPALLSSMVIHKDTKCHLRGNKITTPRFCSYYMKNSINYRGAVFWNIASSYHTDNFKLFSAGVRKDDFVQARFKRKERA